MTQPPKCWMLEESDYLPNRPHIPVTLVCIDTSPKRKLSERAILECEKRATFEKILFLTDDASLKHAVVIPEIQGVEGYSDFVVHKLHKFISTSHCLIVQWDGYMLNPGAWLDQYLECDYIGAPWAGNVVGNGGFSLRSKKLLEATARIVKQAHPEDHQICRVHKGDLERAGCKFADPKIAKQFAIEAATYNFVGNNWISDGRGWNGQFGFHSYLTPLQSATLDRPIIFHHSGDIGDIIYALPAIRSLGGGMLYLSPDCRFPYPRVPRMAGTLDNSVVDKLRGLLEQQEYVWGCRYTAKMPHSVDVDFNSFREFYKTHRPENFFSLYRLHLLAAGIDHPEDEPWLTVDDPIVDRQRPIVVNRTPRYHNDKFPWGTLMALHQDQMRFVGLPDEYKAFCAINHAARVPYVQTDTLLHLAQVVAGSKVFIGNQSTPLAIALGLGKNVIVEEWLANSNTRLARKNAIYVRNGTFNIPKGWLE